MNFKTTYASPLGLLTLASDGYALTGLWMQGQKYFAATLSCDTVECGSLPVFTQAAGWLDRYFAGKRPSCSELVLSPAGSPFRKVVWDILCSIPYGRTITYGEAAKIAAELLGRPHMSAQAVGGAVGHNPISIIIPCHRVLGADGSLTGYAGGEAKKEWLLRHEGAAFNSR